jgi:hypothetical protein
MVFEAINMLEDSPVSTGHNSLATKRIEYNNHYSHWQGDFKKLN